MDMQQRITYLLQQHQAGKLTQTERDELAEILHMEEHRLYITDEITRQMQASEADPAFDTSEWENAFERIVAVDKPVRRILPVRSWLSWAAAVAVIMLAVYFWSQKEQSPAMTQLNKNVTPGMNKAILTLSDGSAIALDSAGKKMFRQGNTAIYQQNGQLQYNVQGNAPAFSYNTLTTPRGGQYQLILPDGSKVWLNAASSLRYPTAFSANERLVELTGEAYFEVQSSSAKPFRVKVNNTMVDVLGTHFNIMAYNDEQAIRTTLLEGSVKVGSHVLHPGQQAAVTGDNEVKVLDNVDVQEAVAWKNGIFQFNRAPLQVVMRQLSRWYDVEVVYEGKIPDLEFLGKMQRELNLSEVLSILEKSGVRFRIDGRKIIVTPL
jgi:ferric-dicitrate binding protein FerR (iron transport regulator)